MTWTQNERVNSFSICHFSEKRAVHKNPFSSLSYFTTLSAYSLAATKSAFEDVLTSSVDFDGVPAGRPERVREVWWQYLFPFAKSLLGLLTRAGTDCLSGVIFRGVRGEHLLLRLHACYVCCICILNKVNNGNGNNAIFALMTNI